MLLKYDVLSSLSIEIRDFIVKGTIILYKQRDGFDDKGTKYILKITDSLIFRLDETGKFILPPLESMPANADITNIIELQKD